jgi:hypothetical protein
LRQKNILAENTGMKNIGLLFCLMLALGCSKNDNTEVSLNQAVLFQVEYENYAWSYQHSGFIIDSSGAVRKFSLPETWQRADSDGYISASGMHANIQQLDPVFCHINKDTLKKYILKLGLVAPYGLTQPEFGSCDGGIVQYSGFVYNSYTNKYKRILIKETGDELINNKSPEADKIYNWLLNIQKN